LGRTNPAGFEKADGCPFQFGDAGTRPKSLRATFNRCGISYKKEHQLVALRLTCYFGPIKAVSSEYMMGYQELGA
jgi:hypothetical protein